MKFEVEWKKYEQAISNSLKNKYQWKKARNAEIWKDILSEAKLLCFEKYPIYDPEKGLVDKFLFYWSEVAYMRYLDANNKATFGNKSFETKKKNLELLTEAVMNEGNPRYLLAFIYQYYLKINPENFVGHGFNDKTVEEVYSFAKEAFFKNEDVKNYADWFETKATSTFDILWERVQEVRNQTFINRSANPVKEIEKWSKQVKKNFFRDELKSKNKMNDENLDPESDDDNLNDGNIDPNELVSKDTPLKVVLKEEKIDILIKLLQYCIDHVDNPKHLFAFLLNLCKISTKEFHESKLYLRSARDLCEYLRIEYLDKSRLSEINLGPVFLMLEKKILPVKDTPIFTENEGDNLPDYSYKARIKLRELITKGNDRVSIMLRKYYGLPKAK
ncbi:MAG: hypothetical protein V1720_22720 [bacterium]